LGKSDRERGGYVGNEVLEVSSGDIAIKKGGDVVGVSFLGKGNSDWCWLVGDGEECGSWGELAN
jgi:hypothetical protein